MKFNIHPIALCRIPQLPLNAALDSSWEILKSSIEKASPNFYDVIKDSKSDEIWQLPESVKQTIWKYFNRSKFRSTPFGSFAGIAQVPIRQGQPVIIAEQNQQSFIDWSLTTTMNKKQLVLKPNDLIFSNSSYYYRLDAIRFLSSINGEFHLSELPFDDIIETVLSLAIKPIFYTSLLQELKKKYPTLTDADKLVKGLIRCQLLFSSTQPNIIGEDYFKRIKFNKPTNAQLYLISKRKIISGSFDKSLFKNLPVLISHLRSMQGLTEQKMLQDFKNKLQRKYESVAVPLLLALDPEMGIGYGDFASGLKSSDILDFIGDESPNNDSNFYKRHLQKVLSNNVFTNQAIDLKDIPFRTKDRQLPLPNSFSLLGYQYGNQVVIEKIGGVSANTLLGRFTLSNDEILKTCREIAAVEQEANPEVIFFDVAYMGEPTVDNVNRRGAIYPFQLSILNFDTSDEPLLLNDLYVYVSDGEIILRSQRLNRRVIPRIASAYNYGRSDLSVFRFLSDLQYQNVQSSLHIGLEEILPDRSYYPRLTFENFILSPAKWQIEIDDTVKFDSMESYLNSIQVSRYFRTGTDDQTLMFDKQNSEDLRMFQKMLRAQHSVTIEEAFIPQEKFITDIDGNHFAHQMVISITHTEQLYIDKKPRGKRERHVICFPPGSEWLYFEIYAHTAYTDDLLENVLQPLIKQWRKHIACFFFIRYDDQGEHIRLRIKVKDKNNAYLIITGLSERLSVPIRSGIVSSFRLNTYYPEIHRYGNKQMQAVEQHFQKDSSYVFSLLNSNFSTPVKYILCTMVFEELETNEDSDMESMLSLTGKIFSSFSKEHNLKPIHFKRMNLEYNAQRNTIRPYLNAIQRKCFTKFIASFKATLKLYRRDMKPTMFADLMHMHINRVFQDRQRTHEMMIYYFVHKDLQRKSIHNKNAIHAVS